MVHTTFPPLVEQYPWYVEDEEQANLMHDLCAAELMAWQEALQRRRAVQVRWSRGAASIDELVATWRYMAPAWMNLRRAFTTAAATRAAMVA
jgi:hypothetical protein